jgi:hypothetical protein
MTIAPNHWLSAHDATPLADRMYEAIVVDQHSEYRLRFPVAWRRGSWWNADGRGPYLITARVTQFRPWGEASEWQAKRIAAKRRAAA